MPSLNTFHVHVACTDVFTADCVLTLSYQDVSCLGQEFDQYRHPSVWALNKLPVLPVISQMKRKLQGYVSLMRTGQYTYPRLESWCYCVQDMNRVGGRRTRRSGLSDVITGWQYLRHAEFRWWNQFGFRLRGIATSEDLVGNIESYLK